jgi:hypothetical protein
MIATLLTLLVATSSFAPDCYCRGLNFAQSKSAADVIFRGRMVSFKDVPSGQRMVVFEVDRVWKGEVGRVFEMPALEGVVCQSFSWTPRCGR